jgi:hypothetical protein
MDPCTQEAERIMSSMPTWATYSDLSQKKKKWKME